MADRHLRHGGGGTLRTEGLGVLRLRFWAAVHHLRPNEDDILRPEGVGPRVCAPGRPFVSFGLQKVMSFGPKVMFFELALLSVNPLPSVTLGSISLWPCKQVREHFRG